MKFIFSPTILLPDDGHDLSKWAVIACDQYTSQPDYWEDLDAFVGEAPSTLRIVFPECYLGKDDKNRIENINRTMDEYKSTVLSRHFEGFMLVRRETTAGPRLGLIAAIDLEQYDFAPGTAPLIRPTEGTIEARLPPRMEIRRHATLESSHVLLLADDPGMTFIEPLYEAYKEREPAYDFELYGGQRVTGWPVEETAFPALEALYEHSDGLLFAVGDGNHSLATAKRVWEEIKRTLPEPQHENNPSRYAMVEINNLHAASLVFEPIHRAIFSANREELTAFLNENGTSAQTVDQWMAAHPECSVDYIHGKDALETLIRKGAFGIEFEPFDKNGLFEYVRKNGPLPRKTFSMGEAEDKRYYLECRRLTLT